MLLVLEHGRIQVPDSRPDALSWNLCLALILGPFPESS